MTALLDPALVAPRGEPVGDWRPARYTDTLTGSEDFTTEGDRLLRLADRHWLTPEGHLELDQWQRWLIRRILETYPPDWPVPHLRGQLRYKQVVVSVARQNGKSLIGALLLLYFLAMHVRGAKVGSFASIEGQARIVYNRLHYAIENDPTLRRAFRLTRTRGITRHGGQGEYRTYPAKESSLQGEPFTAALYDELHLGELGLWDAIVLGQRAKPNAMLVGLTTAGDDSSLLLKRLYAEGQAALDGRDERFGFFVWEAPDDELTPANLIAASPAIACGRIPLDEALFDARKMWESPPDEHGVSGRDRVVRYLLNRFVRGAADAWVNRAAFEALAGDPAAYPDAGELVYALDRTAEWEHATITATRRDGARVYTEVVATINDPTEAELFRACRDLAGGAGGRFVVYGDRLATLGKRLDRAGLDVWVLSSAEQGEAVAAAQAAVKQAALTHAGDPIVLKQSAIARLRHMADAGARLSASLSAGDIDAIRATVAGVFAAGSTEATVVQLF